MCLLLLHLNLVDDGIVFFLSRLKDNGMMSLELAATCRCYTCIKSDNQNKAMIVLWKRTLGYAVGGKYLME
jgi:hypothetical protein